VNVNPAFAQAVAQYDHACPVIAVKHGGRKLRYTVPNRTTLWRVQTLTTKEPGTIEWLEEIEPDSVMLDVGANVGMYTIFASVICGARVFAFEPESQNYALLCRNIVANEVSDRVTAYCAALSDSAKFSVIHLSAFSPGGSCHSFDEAVDFKLESRKTRFSQGCFSATIDQLVRDDVMPVPNYIKIDVDGFEHKVIAGGMETIRQQALKSLIIEINPHLEEHRGIIAKLENLGFHTDPEQIARAARTEGAFEGVGEYVFRR
jgi:FkbM family methyltransferase